jgi:hypothetical protein
MQSIEFLHPNGRSTFLHEEETAMPVTCKQVAGKWRIVDTSGNVEKTEKGTPRDGEGHETREECMAQARAINANSGYE